ncbi:Uncharacterized conserved protein, contains HEPN domain [Ekhidna lutea]|uniref:Uncharacterized conserved protein, contains HEPN domain n=1 Tax=Ekhidna lutea TaxID=447679 RepID=A0A239EX91_EKHLU|nr:HepT-like ribonuclease domain-containing protein [Ekhidna lutea]SNS48918.1 Uncharacterized conserved protein, contains HEPN domain [Ekhidna lutea]
MRPEVLKYLLDIESIISEIEEIKIQLDNDFKKFESSFIIRRAVERELEIIGEAINKLSKLEGNINISGIPNIVSLRNLIIHSYDSIEPELIWAIIHRDIPKLSGEIEKLRR